MVQFLHGEDWGKVVDKALEEGGTKRLREKRNGESCTVGGKKYQ